MCTMCMQCPRRPQEGEDIKSPGTEVTVNCRWPCGSRELNLSPIQEQQMLLSAEPHLWQSFKIN